MALGMEDFSKDLNLFCSPVDKKYNLCGLPLHKKYRGHFEIIALVLEAVKADSATRFSIMKQAGINCAQLKKYLKSLTEMGFVVMELKGNKESYRASDEGLEFLRHYHVLLGMLLTSRARSRLPPPDNKNAVQPVLQRNP
jgi:predicted transcriptional regulator